MRTLGISSSEGKVRWPKRLLRRARCFISYSSEDRDLALVLAALLERRGLDTWLDKDRLRPGDELPSRLLGAIRDSQYFILLWSPPASRSQWVRRELDAALAEHTRIITLRLDSTPLPPELQERVYVETSAETPTAEIANIVVSSLERPARFHALMRAKGAQAVLLAASLLFSAWLAYTLIPWPTRYVVRVLDSEGNPPQPLEIRVEGPDAKRIESTVAGSTILLSARRRPGEQLRVRLLLSPGFGYKATTVNVSLGDLVLPPTIRIDRLLFTKPTLVTSRLASYVPFELSSVSGRDVVFGPSDHYLLFVGGEGLYYSEDWGRTANILYPSSDRLSQPKMTPDWKYVAVTRKVELAKGESRRELILLNLEKKTIIPAIDPDWELKGGDASYSWSRDGSAIAFFANLTGDPVDCFPILSYRCETDEWCLRGPKKPVLTGLVDLSWLGSSRKVLVSTGGGGEYWTSIWDTETDSLSTSTHITGSQVQALDEKTALMIRGGAGAYHVSRIDVQTGNEISTYSESGIYSLFTPSGDGAMVAWFGQSAVEKNRCDLKVMNLQSKRQVVIASLEKPRPLAQGECDLGSLAWSTGSRHLILSPSEVRDPIGNDRFVLFHLPENL